MKEPQSDLDIFRLFGWRCVECGKFASELNHIVLRSRDKSQIENWRNKVPMCYRCHRLYHRGGVTPAKVKSITEKRADALRRTHKKEYI